MVCPELYRKTMAKLYDTTVEGAGYERVYPRKLTAARRRKEKKNTLASMVSAEKLADSETGDEKDILKTWEAWYRSMGYHRVAPFKRSGGLGEPYALYKAKNMTDPNVRREKLHKARPIAPGCKHPAAKVLGLVGRAWSFVVKQLKGDHFIVNTTQEVPQRLREMLAKVAPTAPGEKVKHVVVDIEGCYPHMPKECIRTAMAEVLEMVLAEKKQRGCHSKTISVPHSKRQGCEWGMSRQARRSNISTKMMLECVDFVLENTFLKLGDKILKQVRGIPMGDPLSPAIAVATCAWMEMKWMQERTTEEKQCFSAARFMDDICVLYKTQDGENKTVSELREKCYLPPLRLEEAEQGVFLETQFKCTEEGVLTHRLKDKNEGSDEQQVWRYHRYDSYVPYLQRFGVLMGVLKKVETMASDGTQLRRGAAAKMTEFMKLGYPTRVLRTACFKMHAGSASGDWIDVARSMMENQHFD